MPGPVDHAEPRRLEPRFAFFGRCWCESSDVRRLVSFKNVSRSGAMIQTLSPLAAGVQTTLRWAYVTDKREAEIHVRAKVVWSAPASEGAAGAMGLCFEDVLTPEPLTKFIAERESQA